MQDGRALASRTPSEQCLLDRRQEVVLALLATFISGSGFFSLKGPGHHRDLRRPLSGSSPPRSPCSEATATPPRSPDNNSEAASRLSWDHAHTLVMASLMITGGKVGQMIGRKRAFAIGCIIYACGSLGRRKRQISLRSPAAR
jgi:hypothetical protein